MIDNHHNDGIVTCPMKKEKNKKIVIDIPYKAKKARDMSQTELCRWFSLLNMVKFINHGENLCNMEVDEEDIPHSCMLKYVNTVSGDLESYLTHYHGIPFKYSLDTSHSESKIVEEIELAFK